MPPSSSKGWTDFRADSGHVLQNQLIEGFRKFLKPGHCIIYERICRVEELNVSESRDESKLNEMEGSDFI